MLQYYFCLTFSIEKMQSWLGSEALFSQSFLSWVFLVSFEGGLGAGVEQFWFAFMELIVKMKVHRLGMVFIFFWCCSIVFVWQFLLKKCNHHSVDGEIEVWRGTDLGELRFTCRCSFVYGISIFLQNYAIHQFFLLRVNLGWNETIINWNAFWSP